MKLKELLEKMLGGEVSPEKIEVFQEQLNTSDREIFDIILKLISMSIDSGANRAVDAVIDLIEGMQTKDKDKMHAALSLLTVCNVPAVATLKLWAVVTSLSLTSISKLAEAAKNASEENVDIDSLNKELDELLKN